MIFLASDYGTFNCETIAFSKGFFPVTSPAGIAIDVAQLAKPPNRNRAIDYLVASGATAITIIEVNGVCSFHVGHKINPRVVSVQWLPESQARSIVKRARRDAGPSPDAATAARALAQAGHRTMLTPHDVAITRASEAATKIDGYLEGMRKSGQLQQFNSQFKLRRMAATARGEGFMSYASALSRLRRALIPLLVGGRTVGPVQSLFAEIFDA